MSELATIAAPIAHSAEAELASLTPAQREADGSKPDPIALAMAQTYDRVELREQRQAEDKPYMPPGEDMSAWLDKPMTERREIAKAHSELEERRKEAERFGLTLEQVEAMKQTAALKAQAQGPAPEWREASETLRSLYPNQPEAQTAKWLADVAQYARRDPPGALRWMAQQLGVEPLSINDAGADPGAIAIRDATTRFLQANPDAEDLAEEMSAAISSKLVQIGADHLDTLKRAYQFVRKSKGRKRDPGDTPRARRMIEEEMGEIYDRVAS